MTPDPRHIALVLLQESQNIKTTLDHVLDHFQDRLDAMSGPDRRLCHAIVFGVLRQRAFLDHIIKTFSDMPFNRLDTRVIILLRIALFQMIFLDRIPDFAAINTSIDLAKNQGLKKASGFINAVLRNAAENHSKIQIPHKKNSPAHMAVSFSFPSWLVQKWRSAFGVDQTRILFNIINEIPPLTLRANSLRSTRTDLGAALRSSGLEIEPTQTSPDGIQILSRGVRVQDLPGFDQGHFQVQDEAAQLVGRILDPRPGETVLDACTGLGSKAFHLAQLMKDQGSILGMDTVTSKLAGLDQEALRLGITIVETRHADLLKTTLKDCKTFFDRVLIDAPCSGLGVMRRNPDTKWKRSQNDVIRLSGRQKKMLNAAANLVRPGGVLVYAVCSCEKEENEDVIDSFLLKRKDFTLDKNPDLSFALPGILNPQGFFKTYPDHAHMDGFFAARLIRSPKGKGS
ncbi:16S rRNA (cytosine(967)-C(5))-methyltransferase RsmB [Desulfospira joergensenii]|uniref:16S rRNA (cytosine(967)-C(5))-methyltransferase RsmB n=1 Tax=Desulfospira joergensenii TaxID=53329 RepID=UPI0003B37ABF|nr:16S rRNA (cytosine(967)-C(5))-methyltransferase RsmB [Desulfospira joergensenii]